MNSHGGILVRFNRGHTGTANEAGGYNVDIVTTTHKASGKALGKLGGAVNVWTKSVTPDDDGERSVSPLC